MKLCKARVVIFDMQVDHDVLYHGIAKQPSDAYYTPTLKKWGYIDLHLSVLPSVRPSVRPSINP